VSRPPVVIPRDGLLDFLALEFTSKHTLVRSRVHADFLLESIAKTPLSVLSSSGSRALKLLAACLSELADPAAPLQVRGMALLARLCRGCKELLGALSDLGPSAHFRLGIGRKGRAQVSEDAQWLAGALAHLHPPVEPRRAFGADGYVDHEDLDGWPKSTLEALLEGSAPLGRPSVHGSLAVQGEGEHKLVLRALVLRPTPIDRGVTICSFGPGEPARSYNVGDIVNFKDGVEGIGGRAFRAFSFLRRVEIPAKVDPDTGSIAYEVRVDDGFPCRVFPVEAVPVQAADTWLSGLQDSLAHAAASALDGFRAEHDGDDETVLVERDAMFMEDSHSGGASPFKGGRHHLTAATGSTAPIWGPGPTSATTEEVDPEVITARWRSLLKAATVDPGVIEIASLLMHRPLFKVEERVLAKISKAHSLLHEEILGEFSRQCVPVDLLRPPRTADDQAFESFLSDVKVPFRLSLNKK
jgi:hypothetical protein